MLQRHVDFGAQFRQHCIRHGIARADMARACSLSTESIRGYWHGRVAPHERHEQELADAIAVPRNSVRMWLGRPPVLKADEVERLCPTQSGKQCSPLRGRSAGSNPPRVAAPRLNVARATDNAKRDRVHWLRCAAR
jgi:hypothetical protein